MRFRGNHQTNRIYLTDQFAPISGPFDVAFISDFAGGSFVDVANELEVCQAFTSQSGVNARVLFSEVAHADYCGSYCHGFTDASFWFRLIPQKHEHKSEGSRLDLSPAAYCFFQFISEPTIYLQFSTLAKPLTFALLLAIT